MEFNAHGENSKGKTQSLKEHLEGVAEKAAIFAEIFDGASEARLAGLLHDLGKYSDEFQEYLRGQRQGGVDTHHAVYGAAYAFQNNWLSSFAIAGHHAGLHDRNQLQNLIKDRRYNAQAKIDRLKSHLIEELGELPQSIQLPKFLAQDNPHACEFYIRMLFSCLVDADYLDTEEHYSCSRPLRMPCDLENLSGELLQKVLREKNSKSSDGKVNRIRNQIFEHCLKKAVAHSPDFFSLTVPTGGGKTLSSMAFALAHAEKWHLKRVIVVIPFLSIIEQNASEYRHILDPDNQGLVIEHHSAVPVTENEDTRERSPMELAAENWDAPIIITTSVQFIETLFAASPTRCRKLHNIARSIVIMDEVQTLPTHLLNPLLNVLRELKTIYGVSFLFMTATQPAFRQNNISLSEGFKKDEVREITENTSEIYKVLKRVDYHREKDEISWQKLAERLTALPQALCVVNTRKHAFELWEALREALSQDERDSVFHLSSSMCAEHRLSNIGGLENPREGSIRYRLKHGLPCRVVSTQVVEAGVDFDFPVVFRSLGPLDSIVQAAGRCNREGRLKNVEGQPINGQVIIFTPEQPTLPPGIYKTAAAHTASFWERITEEILGTDPAIFGDYFSQLFQMANVDSNIQTERSNLHFRSVAAKAKVIQDEGKPVIVPFDKGKKLIKEIRERIPQKGRLRFDKSDLRRLQRFMVNVRTNDFRKLEHFNMVTRLLPNLELYVLEEGSYNKHLGLLIDRRPMEDFLCQ